MAIEANTPKDWGMRGATNVTLPQFKGKSRQLIVNIDDGYRPIIMDGITLGGKFKSASLDELNAGLATKLDATAKAESAKVADSANSVVGSNVSGTVANATNAVNAKVADSATKATQDANGNVIHTTYATKSELDGISIYASKEDIISAAEMALNGANPVSASDPTLDEIKVFLATIQAQLSQLESRRYVKETGKSSDGTSWYRVWSDGWIEQGGTYTSSDNDKYPVTLSKNMTTTNYHSTVTGGYDQSSGGGYGYCYDKTTSGFKAVVIEPSGTWYVCGY